MLYIAGQTSWEALPAGSEDVITDNTSSSHSLLSSAAVEPEMKNSSLELVTQSPSAIAANSVSSLPQQRLDPSRGGQMIAPILSRKGTSKSGAFPKEKAHNERTPFPREQSARALRPTQAPSAIAANSVSSLPQQRLDPSRGGQMIAPILSRKGMS